MTTNAISVWERGLGYPVADKLEAMDRLLVSLGQKIIAPHLAETISWTHAYTRRMVEWWESGWDLLVSPILNGPPPRLGSFTRPAAGELLTRLLQFTPQFNVTGQPAMSLPPAASASGLPIGVHFVAAPGREDLLARLASQIEEAEPRPSISRAP